MNLVSHFKWDKFVPVLAVTTLIVGSFQNENFLTAGNMTFLIQSVAEIMLIAFSMTLLIIAGRDRPVGRRPRRRCPAARSASAGSTPAACRWPWSWRSLTGVACGAFNGFLVTQLGLQSLAVTIGTLALYRGLCYALLGDGRLKPFPTGFTSINYRGIAGTWVPYVTVLLVVFGLVFGIVLHATPFGRRVFAIGQSKEAARFAGIPVRSMVFRLFVVNGLMAGIAGVVYTIRFASARPDGAVGLELEVIAAALFAGVSIFGGVGTMWAVASSVLFLGSIRSLLRLNDFTANQLTIVTGSLLLLSVVIPAVITRVRERTRSEPPPRPRAPIAPGLPGPDAPVTEQG